MSRPPEFAAHIQSANSLADLFTVSSAFGYVRPLRQPLRQLWERSLVPDAVAAAVRKVVSNPDSATLMDFLVDREAQRELKRSAEPDLRRELLRGMKRMLLEPMELPANQQQPVVEALDDSVPGSPESLQTWVNRHGIPDALGAPLSVLSVLVGQSAVQHIERQFRGSLTIQDVVSTNSGQWARAAYATLMKLRPAAVRWLLDQVEEVRWATAEESTLLDAKAPEDPVLSSFHEVLLQVRKEHRRGTVPTSNEVRRRGQLVLLEDPPVLQWVDPRSIATAWTAGRTHVRLSLEGWRAGQMDVSCSACGTVGIRHCRHGLAALDAALSAVQRPESEFAEKLREVLGSSSWGRTLALLKRLAPPAPTTEPENVRLVWRIDWRDGARGELRLKPVLQKQGKKGGWTAGQSVRLEDLATDDRGQFREEDRRAAAFLLADRHRTFGLPLWSALKALVGHPHVTLTSAPQLELRVVEAELGLCCIQTADGAFTLTAGLQGQAVDPKQLHLISREPPGYVLARPEQGELVLIRCPSTVRQMLDVLSQRGATFPAEAEETLAQELTSLPVNVTLPPKLAGEEQPPRTRPVLVAELDALTLSVETHVRPLAGGLTFPVGAGPVQVRGEDRGRRYFTVRRFDEEQKEAAALWARLAPTRAEAGNFSFTAEGQDAVEWLKRLEQLASEGVEVVFPPRRPRILRPVRGADLRVSVRDARDWFGLAGAAEVEGDRIELAVMLEAARRRQRFVPVGENAWAEVSAELLAKLAPLADSGGDDRARARGEPGRGAGAGGPRRRGGRARRWAPDAGGDGLAARGDWHDPDSPLGNPGRAPPVSAGRVRVACAARGVGAGRVPRGRHGSGQDPPGPGAAGRTRGEGALPGGGADVGLFQLGGRSREVRPGPPRPRVAQV